MKYSKIPIFITIIVLLLVFVQVAITKTLPAASTQPDSRWKKVECSWELIQKYFSRYYKFYPELYWEWGEYGWQYLDGKYKCEDVLQFILQKEKTSWKRELKISYPKSGIKTGLFIIKGQIISPPYKLEISNENSTLTLNSVIIYPTTGAEVIEKTELELLLEKAADFGHKIEKNKKAMKRLQYRWFSKYLNYLISTYGKVEGLSKFKNYMKSLINPGKIIADFKFFDEDKMIFDFKYRIDDHWDVPLKYQLTDEQWDIYKDDPVYSMSDEEARKYIESQKRIASIAKIKDLKSEIEEALLADKIVLLGAIEDYYILTPEQYAEIVKILKRSNLDTLSKLEAVNSVVSQVADETDSTLISLILVFNNSFD